MKNRSLLIVAIVIFFLVGCSANEINTTKTESGIDVPIVEVKNEDDKIVAAATEDIDYDNIYLRLSLLGVQQVANGENFIKVNIE